jgi:RNA polymerase sigma factor (sigma-70 family)
MNRDKKRVLSEFLVLEAQGGDRRALDRLVRLWQPDLLRHAWRLMGEGEAAHDALQDAWLDIVRGLSRLKDSAAFPAWAYRIVTRKCANLIRKRQQVRRTKQAVAAEVVGEINGVEIVDQLAELASVSAAIANLPPDQRSTIALYHRDELSVAEIAVALDVPVGTVKTRLMHARRKIRACLETENEGGAHDEQG